MISFSPFLPWKQEVERYLQNLNQDSSSQVDASTVESCHVFTNADARAPEPMNSIFEQSSNVFTNSETNPPDPFNTIFNQFQIQLNDQYQINLRQSEDLKKENQNLKLELTDIQTALSNLQKEKVDLMAKLANVDVERKQMQDYMASQLDMIKKDKVEMTTTLGKVKDYAVGLQLKNKNIENYLERVSAENDEKEQRIKSLMNELQVVTAERDETKNKLDTYESQKTNWTENFDTFIDSLQSCLAKK